MFTRRELLKTGAIGGAALMLPFKNIARAAAAQATGGPIAGSTLLPYIDPLPLPSILKAMGTNKGVAQYQVTMSEFRQQLHGQLPPTTLWGYNGSYPGPTIETRAGQAINVRWNSNLPARHLLPVDPTLHGAMGPEVRNVVHLHGARVLPTSDGRPEAWFTPGFGEVGPAFDPAFRTYFYPNDQPAAQLWYHDHAIGITRLNVHAGLAGLYTIRDAQEDALNLPRGRFEMPLVIQDRRFNFDGSLFFPVRDWEDPDPRVAPIWSPEFFGDTVLVNGKVWPFLEVEQRKYRFRILNASNARFYHMRLTPEGGGPDLPFVQIGADLGFLPVPVALGDLLMAPAERCDVIVDFTQCPAGQRFVLTNDALAPYPFGPDDAPDPTLPGTTGQIMQFRVVRRSGRDNSQIPTVISSPVDVGPAVTERTLMLSELASALDNVIHGQLGGSPLNATSDNPTGGLFWDDPVTETPRAGTTEIWNIVNATGDAHPIHVHLVNFFVLERQLFDLPVYLSTGEVVPVGPPIPPQPNELFAPKDTVHAGQTDQTDLGLMTRIKMRFDLPSNAVVNPGDRLPYVWHCHIIDHEDNDMMRPYEVIV